MKFSSISKPAPPQRVKKRDFSSAEYADGDDSEEVARPKNKKKDSNGSLGGRKDPTQFNGHEGRRRPSFDGASEENRRRRYEADAPEEDDLPPMRRNGSREVVVFQADQGKPSVAPEVVEALRSRFGERSSVILSQIESDDTDGATTLIYRSLLVALVDMLPVMESAVRNSKGARGVYQFNQTVSQIRELLNDIQSVRDRGLLGNSIVERHIRPSYMNIGVQIVQALTMVSEAARERMDASEYKTFRDGVVHQVKMSLADYIKRQHDEVTSAVIQSLS